MDITIDDFRSLSARTDDQAELKKEILRQIEANLNKVSLQKGQIIRIEFMLA